MEEISTTTHSVGIELAYKDRCLHIFLVFPSLRIVVSFEMHFFLTQLHDIESVSVLETRNGRILLYAKDKDHCMVVYEDLFSPASIAPVRHDMGILNYRDLLTAINMELNRLRLRDRREEIFKRPVPPWKADGGFFW
jgi:hypothetical protein